MYKSRHHPLLQPAAAVVAVSLFPAAAAVVLVEPLEPPQAAIAPAIPSAITIASNFFLNIFVPPEIYCFVTFFLSVFYTLFSIRYS